MKTKISGMVVLLSLLFCFVFIPSEKAYTKKWLNSSAELSTQINQEKTLNFIDLEDCELPDDDTLDSIIKTISFIGGVVLLFKQINPTICKSSVLKIQPFLFYHSFPSFLQTFRI